VVVKLADEQSGRRGFIKKAGVGAALAWTVPSIVAVTPAAAQQGSPGLPTPLGWVGVTAGPGTARVSLPAAPDSGLFAQPGDLLLAVAAVHIDASHPGNYVTPRAPWTMLGEETSQTSQQSANGHRSRLFSYVYGGQPNLFFTKTQPTPGASSHWTVLIVNYGSAAVDGVGSAGTPDAALSILVPMTTQPTGTERTLVFLGVSQHPPGSWTPQGGYTTQVQFNNNSSRPEILVADHYTGVLPVADVQVDVGAAHPLTGFHVGLAGI
jgi:hypothetical protein